jgi:hypothetical protein
MIAKGERLDAIAYLEPFEGTWPLLLGVALGVRLTRVHADIRAELHKAGAPPPRAYSFGSRLLALYSRALQRLRSVIQRNQ